MEEYIKLNNVIVRSGNFDVLREVSISFPKGLSTVIMGPSGCGKSTLLKTAAGITPPDIGNVFLEGKDMFKLSDKKAQTFRSKNGFVFQDAALWSNESIFDNLALPLRLHFRKISKNEVTHNVNNLLEQMNMLYTAQLRPAQLSFGERKIISFLRAVALEPSVLFMDEPTPFIDHILLEKIMNMIKKLKNNGCTIIAVTHDSHLTSMIANYLVIMKEGKILEADDIKVVRKSTDPDVVEILSQVLSEAATYDTDLLDLLDG